MDTSYVMRHQLIKDLMAQRTEKVADAAVDLWAQIATQIISIVGEGGFNSLYARSVFLAKSEFPWLAAISLPSKSEHRFAELKSILAGQSTRQAGEANSLLLITFTDILSSIIGEDLTMSILQSAWGTVVSNGTGDEKHLAEHPKELKK
jgi:hypothetical protein